MTAGHEALFRKREGPLLTRGDLVELTGVENDALTFWIRKELVRSVGPGPGSGKRLRFPYYEANMVALLMQLRVFGASVDVLSGIAGIYRGALDWASKHSILPEDVEFLWYWQVTYRKVLIGQRDEPWFFRQLEKLANARDPFTQLTDRRREFAFRLKHEDVFRYEQVFDEITSRPLGFRPEVRDKSSTVHHWRSPEGWKCSFDDNASELARKDDCLVTLSIDLTETFRPIWTKAMAKAYLKLRGQERDGATLPDEEEVR